MTASNAEDLLAFQLRAVGIEFVQQHIYAPPRKLRADFGLTANRLLVWVDGGIYSRQAHGSISGILKDIERANEAACHDWLVIRCTPDMVKDGSALAMVERFLEGR